MTKSLNTSHHVVELPVAASVEEGMA